MLNTISNTNENYKNSYKIYYTKQGISYNLKNRNLSFGTVDSNKSFKSTYIANEDLNSTNFLQTTVNNFLSHMSYFFSVAAHEFKVLILAGMVAKKPINKYMDEKKPCQ